MNASARALAAGTFTGYNLKHMMFSVKNFFIVILLSFLLITSFAIIYIKNETRQEVTELHSLQENYQHLMVERGQLLLEKNTWSSPIRIESIAQSQNMINSVNNKIVFI